MMTTCPDCRAQVSEHANTCPNCGYSFANKRLKKAAQDAAALALVLYTIKSVITVTGAFIRWMGNTKRGIRVIVVFAIIIAGFIYVNNVLSLSSTIVSNNTVASPSSNPEVKATKSQPEAPASEIAAPVQAKDAGARTGTGAAPDYNQANAQPPLQDSQPNLAPAPQQQVFLGQMPASLKPENISARYLSVSTPKQNVSNAPTEDIKASLETASAQLTDTYQRLRQRLSPVEQRALKEDQWEWIKMMYSIPSNSPQALEKTRQRIQTLSVRLTELR